jgi:hypothetical protein
MSLMTYLLKDRHGTQYFRRVIPLALRPHMPPPWRGKANFKRTLGTKKPNVAKAQAEDALRECTVAFQNAEMAQRGETAKPITPVGAGSIAIEDIEADVIAQVLAADEREREEGDDRRRLCCPAQTSTRSSRLESTIYDADRRRALTLNDMEGASLRARLRPGDIAWGVVRIEIDTIRRLRRP